MSNRTVPAAAEGMPSLNRRTFLRSTAAAATLGGMAIMATPSASAASPTLVAMIAEHKDATREWLDALSVENDIEEDHLATLMALRQSGGTQADVGAMRRVLNAEPRALASEDAGSIASAREDAALQALFAFPVATLADLRLKLEHLMTMPGGDDSFGLVSDPATTLMRSILGGGLV